MEATWTIQELAERAAQVLAAPDGFSSPEPGAAAPRVNGRVRDVPNERLIRWYATVGLIDPPLSRRGRVARYGSRHLLQLLAVKRRQAEGRSLAEIQAELAGATDEALAAAAGVPATGPGAGGPQGSPGAAPPAPDRFWARQPVPPDPPAPAGDRSERDTPLVHGIRLAPGVVLLLEDADREPGSDDVTGILNAARPLLRALAERGLCTPGNDTPPGVEGA